MSPTPDTERIERHLARIEAKCDDILEEQRSQAQRVAVLETWRTLTEPRLNEFQTKLEATQKDAQAGKLKWGLVVGIGSFLLSLAPQLLKVFLGS